MQCPKCGFNQADGVTECGKCGVIIAKVLKSQQPLAAARPVSPPLQATAPVSSSLPEPPDKKKTDPLILIASLLLVANVAVWWINFPPAGKVPEGAYVNTKHQFALSAPPDWLQLTPENSKRIFDETKDRFTGAVRNMLEASVSAPGVAVGFIKMPDSAAEFTPSVNVVVLPLQMPPLNESVKGEAVAGMVGEMKKGLADYTKESASLIEVDGLTSLEIIGSVPLTVVSQKAEPIIGTGAYGMRRIVGYTPEVRKTFTVKLRQLVVPGKMRSYLISYTGDAANFADLAPVFNSVTGSFRVLQRPPRFGRIMRGMLNGVLFSICAYLAYLLINGLSKRYAKS